MRLQRLGPYDLSKIPVEIAQQSATDSDNQVKYVLTNYEAFLNDRNNIVFSVHQTDWNSVINVVRFVRVDTSLRHKFAKEREWGALTPAKSRIPSIFCLHAVVSFEDDSLLVLKRDSSLEFSDGKLSLSFEEQLSDTDFKVGGDVDSVGWWVRRAICEEVFPLRSKFKEQPEQAWHLANDKVRDIKIWSLIFEEELAGWALTVHIRLDMPSGQFVSVYRQIQQFSGDTRDSEGDFALLGRAELRRLIQDGKATVQSLSAQKAWHIGVEQLHPTALYRALTFDRLLAN